jgi:hypothetical protein
MTGGRKMKKVIKYIVYLTINLLFIVELIKVIRLFDIKEIINISNDAWLGFFGNILSVIITIIGFMFTIYRFTDEKEEKEKPLLIIKPSNEKECLYRCDNIENNCTQHRKVYFELVNKGNTIIKYPQIKNENGRLLNIYKSESENELEILEPKNFQTSNKYIISIDVNFLEGMRFLYCELL